MKRVMLAAPIGVAVLIAAAIAFAVSYRSFLSTPLAVPEEGIEFSIPSGTSFSAVAGRLEADGIIENANWLKLHGRLTGNAEKIL